MRGWCSGWRKGCAQSSRGRRATCSTSVGCSTESFAIRLARRQRALLEKRYAAATCVRRITTRAHADQLVGSLDALPHGVRSHATKSPCRLHPERAAGGGMKQSGARASFGRRGGPGGSWARAHRFGGAPRLPGGAAGGRTFAAQKSGIHSPMRSLGGWPRGVGRFHLVLASTWSWPPGAPREGPRADRHGARPDHPPASRSWTPGCGASSTGAPEGRGPSVSSLAAPLLLAARHSI